MEEVYRFCFSSIPLLKFQLAAHLLLLLYERKIMRKEWEGKVMANVKLLVDLVKILIDVLKLLQTSSYLGFGLGVGVLVLLILQECIAVSSDSSQI